ncbi:MAG TPA: Ig-like domain-containing protein [Gemmatimonadales bacterium]|nr:Ig-like domain-containing protein [Gemmatimonadales bacterium]
MALATVVLFACTTDTLIGPKDVAILSIEPDTVAMPVGDTILLEGVATDSRGVKYIGEKITWTTSNASVVEITADGHLISLAVGTATVTASAGGKTASAVVTVTPPAVIALSADSLAFGAIAKGPTPATKQIIITNGSPGILTGLTPGSPVYVGPDTGWLSVIESASTAPDTLTFSVTIDTFPIGTYTATVPVTAAKASNNPQSIKVTLTLSAGTPTSATKTAGDTQSVVVQTAVPLAPAVTVKDQFGNPVAGVAVTFAVAAGNGALTGPTPTTNAAGVATLGSWTLDTAAKVDTLTATAGALPPVTFTATARPAAAAQIQKTAGDAQTAAVATLLPNAPTVTVRDRFGNPVPGATVTFAAGGANGSITGSTPVTGAQGTASVGSWTLGTTARTDTLTASVAGVASPAIFTATAQSGAAATIAKSAGGTTGTVNTNVSPAPAVLVTDQFGNPVAGVGVTFAATASNGTVTGGVVTTGAGGIATVGSFKLATLARIDTLTATSGTLAGSPVIFVVTASAGVATTAAKNGGDAQTHAAGGAVDTAPSVIVKDAFGNPVSGVTVTFAVTGGGGSLTGGTPITNAAGVAAVGSWQLGSLPGPNSLSATVSGLPVLTFTATAVAGPPANLVRISAASRTDTIGATLPTDTVQVTDALGNPVAGTTVTWTAGGGGSLTPGGATTNASGYATAVRVLGTTPGTVTDQATSAGLAGSPAQFSVTTNPGHAATLVKGAGDLQTDTVGATLPVAYADTVKDRAGNPVAGVTVTWAAAGGGNITASSLSGANGAATATRTLGTTAGPQTATGTAAGLAGSPTSFSATATHGNAKTLAIVAGTSGQSASAGTAVATTPAVKVTDQFANPVSGVTVTFALGAGGARNGSITGSTPATNASGVATLTTWTLGPTTGPDTVTATVAGLTGSPAVFVDNGTTGSAALISAAGGNAQTDTVKGTLPRLDSVLVTDAVLNPVSGVTVTWAVTKGGGNITASSITNANGIATAQWVLGDTAGAQTATATSGSLGGSPVTFTATATAGAPASVTKNAGDGQTGAAGTAVGTALSVLVKDQFNNPVPGVTVTFAPVGAASGSVGGGTPTTTAGGIATLGSWTLGTAAKTDSLTATAGTAAPVTFTATVTAGAAKTIARLGSAGQSDTIGASLPIPDSVKVTDQFGNPVAGTTVTWAAGGAGTLTPGGATTNAAGIATATRVLGTVPGVTADTAKAAGLTGSPITFSVTTTVGAAASIVKGAGDAQTDTVGATLAIAYTDTVKDRVGNPVAGVTVTWGVTGGGSITPSSITGANGVAGATRVLGTTAGAQGATATVTGLAGSPVSFSATATHGAAKILAAAAGTNGQAATISTPVGVTPGAKVTDQFGNPVAGVTVNFALGAGGARNGAITGTAQSTNASGIATLSTWTLGSTAGPDTVVATSAGLTGSPFLFIDFGNSGSATTIALAGGNNQTDTVRSTLPRLDSVLVTDVGSNPVGNVSVTWTVTKGHGNITASSLTNGQGIAVAQWVLGDTAEVQTAQAAVGGLAGSPVAFSATATHGNAKVIGVNGGNGQTATVNTAVATAPSVLVTDAYGNPVSGTSVTFASTARSGTVTSGSQSTNASGIATVGGWQLGTTAGPDTLTATSAGLTGSPLLFFATGTGGSATTIARLGLAAQSDTIGATLGVLDSVKVTDTFGNPISGVTVTWAAGGAGSLTPTGSTTNAQGIATATRVLGSAAGVVTDTAKAAGLVGSPVTFTTTTNAGHAANIALNGGDAQTDTAAATLPTAYTVLITDRAGNAVSGTTVTWGVSGGGSITPSSISGVNGLATATRVLGTTAGPQGATATAAGLTGSPVPFSATATSGAAKTISIVAGTNGQTATISTAVGSAPAAKVVDQFGNPVLGQAVTFALGAGGARNGSLTAPTAPTTNAGGIATVGGWTLGSHAGPDTVTATAAGLTGSPLTYVDNGTAGAAATIALAGGNNQTDTVRATLARLDSVLVTDAGANPVSGVTVTWTVTKGAGAVTPSSITDVNGIATAQWTLGDTAEVQTVTAASGSLGGSPVTFSATATHGNAKIVALNAGGAQTDTVGATLPIAPSVLVTDAYGNPVPGVGVTFAVTAGGGGLTGGTPVTNASGIAAVGSWTLGTAAVTNTMTATSGGLTGSPVTINATATAGNPKFMTVNAGNNQTAQVNALLPTAPAVLVTDANLNPVANVAVFFTVNSGNGSLVGNSPTTNASGIATLGSWQLSAVAKVDTLTASSAGLTNVPFVATAMAGPAANLVKFSGDAQTDSVGTKLNALVVKITDAGGNPVSGATVNWLVTSGSAALSSASSLTDTAGLAADTATFGTTAGGVSIQASSGVLTPVSFSETATPGNPTSMSKFAGDGQSATVNTTVSTAPAVKVVDQFGNPVSGVSITFAPPVNHGSVTGGLATTGVNGVATVGSWTLDSVAGANTLTATSGPALAGSPAAFSATGNAGAVSASKSSLVAGTASITACASSCSAGTTASTLTVTAVDQFNNPVNGAAVTFASTGSSNTFTPSASGNTNASGVLAVTYNSSKAEAKTLSVTAGGVGVTQTQGVTVNPAAVDLTQSTVAVSSASMTACSTSCVVGSTAVNVTVTVKDAFGNVRPGSAVTISATGSGNTITNPSGTTDVNGQWIGTYNSTSAAAHTVSATANFSTIVQTQTETVNHAAATTAAISSGNGQTARVGVGVGTKPAVLITDAFGNVVPSVTVTFSITGGGGSATGTTPTTNASGIATLTSWTMGSANADASNGTMSNTMNASASGTNTVTFTDFGIYTFSGDVTPLISTGSTCTTSGCHSWTYANTVGQSSGCGSLPTLILTGGGAAAATSSDLYNKLASGSPTCGGAQMPPTASGYTLFTAAQLKVVRAWIENGAANN